jgi:glycosyltransferase
MKISIITTCFNREKSIGNTVNSVLSQEYPEVEFIVIDGASTDGSVDIIRSYEDKIATFVSEPDGGMYEAINKGIRLATGNIIGLMHSDDMFYSENILPKIADVFKKNDVDIIYGNGIYVDENNTRKIVRDWISGDYTKEKMRRGWLPLHPTVYVKRKVFEQVGLYDESYRIAADSDMLVRMLYKYDFKVHYLNEYIVCMQMGGMSTSISTQKKKWEEDIRMYRSHGFNPYIALGGKIISKIPQFVNAGLGKNKRNI